MNRKAAVLTAAIAVLIVAGWLVLRPAATERPGEAALLADLMRDLGIVPVAGPAKPFSLSSLDGKAVSLADFKGRPLLVYFWATW